MFQDCQGHCRQGFIGRACLERGNGIIRLNNYVHYNIIIIMLFI